MMMIYFISYTNIIFYIILVVISIIAGLYYTLTAIQEVPGLIPGYTLEIFLEV